MTFCKYFSMRCSIKEFNPRIIFVLRKNNCKLEERDKNLKINRRLDKYNARQLRNR